MRKALMHIARQLGKKVLNTVLYTGGVLKLSNSGLPFSYGGHAGKGLEEGCTKKACKQKGSVLDKLSQLASCS
jgi:hypothetical protein